MPSKETPLKQVSIDHVAPEEIKKRVKSLECRYLKRKFGNQAHELEMKRNFIQELEKLRRLGKLSQSYIISCLAVPMTQSVYSRKAARARQKAKKQGRSFHKDQQQIEDLSEGLYVILLFKF